MSVESEKELAARTALARALGLTLGQYDAAMAVPTDVVRDICADAYRSRAPSSIIPKPNGDAPVRPNVGSERPLGPPRGIDYVDRLVDQADALDKVELVRRLAGLTKE
jgi:hypothetical protein